MLLRIIRSTLRAICWTSGVGLLLTVAGACQRTSQVSEVEIVLPDRFRGGFAIDVDPKAGQEVSPSNGKYTIEIGKDGKLQVKNADFLRDFRITARYQSGGKVGGRPDADSLWGGGIEFDEIVDGRRVEQARYWFFVGSEQEFKKWNRTKNWTIGSVSNEGKTELELKDKK
jgi:hypothetical protein